MLAAGKWGVEPSGESGERTGTLVVNVSGPGAASFWGVWEASAGIHEAFALFNEATNGEMYNDVWYILYRDEAYAEFSKLGTYTLRLSSTVSLNAGTPTDTTDDTAHTATATYTIHVGPFTDLSVADGGASPHVASARNALTIAAVNKGPDHARGARVTGLPSGAEVIHISQGNYNGSTGVWKHRRTETKGEPPVSGQVRGCNPGPGRVPPETPPT